MLVLRNRQSFLKTKKMADLFSSQISPKIIIDFIDTKFLQYSQAAELCDFCNRHSFVNRANFARECRVVVCSEMDREDQVERILVLYWCSICKEKWA